LATVTKPVVDYEARVKAALKIKRSAAARAAKIAIDEQINISTRRRRAEKVRSEVLDEIEAALTGKDAAKS
jgi:hypothetical protein